MKIQYNINYYISSYVGAKIKEYYLFLFLYGAAAYSYANCFQTTCLAFGFPSVHFMRFFGDVAMLDALL